MIQFLIFVLGFIGLLIGILIAFFTKEELEPGKYYFMMLEKIVLFAISLVIVFFVRDFLLFFILGLCAGFVFRKVYFYLGFILPLATGSFLLILASLTFIFGLPHSALLCLKFKREWGKEVILSSLFFFIAVFLSYLWGFTPILVSVSGAFIIISIFGSKKFGICPII